MMTLLAKGLKTVFSKNWGMNKNIFYFEDLKKKYSNLKY